MYVRDLRTTEILKRTQLCYGMVKKPLDAANTKVVTEGKWKVHKYYLRIENTNNLFSNE